MATIKDVPPAEIEAQSFAFIESEFVMQTGVPVSRIDPDRFQVIRWVVLAT
mgnify:CR=1 FL=1